MKIIATPHFKSAMPRWHEFQPTVTLYHGTSLGLLEKIKSQGLAPPTESMESYARSIAEQYINPIPPKVWDFIQRHVLSLRADSNQHIVGRVVYLTPNLTLAEGYARSYAEDGGEIGFEIYRFVKGYFKEIGKPPPPPIYRGSTPVVLEVEIPHEWMKTYHDLSSRQKQYSDAWKDTSLSLQNKYKSESEFMDQNSNFEVRVTQTIPPHMIKNVHEVK